MHIVQSLFNRLGYEVCSYSGRGMYGQSCLAAFVFTDHLGKICADLLEAAQSKNLSELVVAFRMMRTDNMGRQTVVYFPDIQYFNN